MESKDIISTAKEETSDQDTGTMEDQDDEIPNPINDIIDYLVRCANISFKTSHVDESSVHTKDKIQAAKNLYNQSPSYFLTQFGKYLTPCHLKYFEDASNSLGDSNFCKCVQDLKTYHSEENRHKRIRNRRFKALQKLKVETEYFSEKEMMSRNPLLYEQLVGQFLTDAEIKHRDRINTGNQSFLSLILETVDRNEVREKHNEQKHNENLEYTEEEVVLGTKSDDDVIQQRSKWGEFETPDPTPTIKPEKRKQSMISAPEKRLLKEEFLQEMYTSFIDGDDDYDYSEVDNNEEYDDLQQASQDAEDRYFDSETTEIENLEEHMKLVEVYGGKNVEGMQNHTEDALDVYMEHLNRRLK